MAVGTERRSEEPMTRVNVIGDVHPEGHVLSGCRGEAWISLSSAVAVYGHRVGAAVVFPDGGALLVDESPEALFRRAAESS